MLWAALLSGLAVLGGCAPRFVDAPPPSASLRETEGRGVILLTGARLREPAEVLAIVQVHLPHGAEDHGLEVLATEAAALGADAVVGVEYYRALPATRATSRGSR
ncbi:MAG: hypothetical protein KC731_21290 [Myxococcales bacterium]|nr:hypothetical protein [Myxococcales bacterium]